MNIRNKSIKLNVTNVTLKTTLNIDICEHKKQKHDDLEHNYLSFALLLTDTSGSGNLESRCLEMSLGKPRN